jgi:hypothetical protein
LSSSTGISLELSLDDGTSSTGVTLEPSSEAGATLSIAGALALSSVVERGPGGPSSLGGQFDVAEGQSDKILESVRSAKDKIR